MGWPVLLSGACPWWQLCLLGKVNCGGGGHILHLARTQSPIRALSQNLASPQVSALEASRILVPRKVDAQCINCEG
ncbi:hypothetical protein GGTG_10897 [Gaeumannomyces tritici R3-111a-1]|uniref:Secreted protein n=1 Tax=Gaeumannomyces tritici (strain R3-111a-1) TaxID=644352 RepID=J3PBM5_GAET3|nr:hypothetical protein GGTG_10897 [Gaeumannomyces tritici R3-111a-1]EJT71642.1 hypothetical protein GGTG_10897 [Gaeumannomyces tritici R3-111a-1]